MLSSSMNNLKETKIRDRRLKLKVIACGVLARELYHLAAVARNIIDIQLLPQGLHNEPDKLRQRLQQRIDAVLEEGMDYDAILLGYGLCSNGLAGITARNIPLIVPRGHDCITILLGSKEAYKDYFDAHGGVYWYSPGWIERSLPPGKERYERTLQQYIERYGEDNALYLMETENNWHKEYSLATYIDWEMPDSEEYKGYTRECAAYLGWGYDEFTGDEGLLQRLLNGDWNNDDFLTVPPESMIVPNVNSPEIIACKLCNEEAKS
ncbi:MAG: DUF1638 domain-containing protein [bacterium]|jgi:hypothetical protein